MQAVAYPGHAALVIRARGAQDRSARGLAKIAAQNGVTDL